MGWSRAAVHSSAAHTWRETSITCDQTLRDTSMVVKHATTVCSFSDYRRHLHNVVHGCRELESCQLISAEDGRSLLGVHITLRMRLQCEVWR